MKCKVCSKEFQQYSTLDKYCSYLCKNEAKTIKTSSKRKSIAPISKSRAERLKVYRELRDEYLKNNPYCEVKGCTKETTNLHHKAGRIGDNLTNVAYFMACCSTCHPKKIHENPKWARENGYLI